MARRNSKLVAAVNESVIDTQVIQGNDTISNAAELPVVFYSLTVRGKADKTNVNELSETLETNATAEAGTVKALVTRIPAQWAKPIKHCESEIRTHFKKEGIPLGDKIGIPLAILPEFKSKLDRMTSEFELHFNNLITAMETGELVDVLTKSSGTNIDKIKIPTLDEIRGGYGVKISCYVNYNSGAVKTALTVLSDELKDILRKDVEESVKKDNADQINSANEKIIGTVKAFLKDVTERCSEVDNKGTHWKSMVDKYEFIVKILPAYNITKSPELQKLLETVRTVFDGMNKETLKADVTTRQKMIEKADTVSKGFASML